MAVPPADSQLNANVAPYGVLRHDGRGLHDFPMQTGPAEAEIRAGNGVQDILELRQAPEEHEYRQHDIGSPRPEHDRSRIA